MVAYQRPSRVSCRMSSTAIARRLRRDQTDEERELWLALKAGRFAGFKFRRQHQWRKNRDGVLLGIWEALHRRTGCVKVMRKEQNHRFVPPKPEQLIGKPAKPPGCWPRQ